MKTTQQKKCNKKYKLTFLDWFTITCIAATVFYLIYVGAGFIYEHYTLKSHHYHLS